MDDAIKNLDAKFSVQLDDKNEEIQKCKYILAVFLFLIIDDNIFDPVLYLVTAQNADLMEAISELEASMEQMQKSIGNEINSCKSKKSQLEPLEGVEVMFRYSTLIHDYYMGYV